MLLALDLATNTGWCAGDGSSDPELGTVRMPSTGEEIGPFGDFFERWLNIKLDELQPSMVMFEAPLLPGAKIGDDGHLVKAPTSIATTRKLQGLAWSVEVQCHRRRLEVREVYGATVKKELSGSGRGQKPDMMAAARRCGLAPKSFDEADAFGVWLVGVRYYASKFRQRWDQRLYGPATGHLRL